MVNWKSILAIVGALIGLIYGYYQFGDAQGIIGIGLAGAIVGAFIGLIIDKISS